MREGGVRPARPPTLLVLRALGLGDLLTAVPALRALARAFPAHRRVLAAPRSLAPLLELIGPDPRRLPGPAERVVHELVDVPAWVGGPTPPADAAALLPAHAVAVNLHGRGPESHRLLLATRSRHLLAFAHSDVPESAGGPPWREGEHEVKRWCRLLRAHGIAADARALDLPAPLAAPAADGPRPMLLHPGAASAARRWPAGRWAHVARAQRIDGRTVLLTGSAAEVPLARRIAAAAGLPPGVVLAGRTDVSTLASLVARAERVVCADTGLAHLAAALRTPSVVLFGPTSPAAWGPPPDRPWHRVLWHGCHGDPHADRPDAGLLAIEPEEVIEALATLPRAPSRSVRGAFPDLRRPTPSVCRQDSDWDSQSTVGNARRSVTSVEESLG